MIGCAKRMVTQNFDDPAIGNLAARTLHDHALEFGFQRGQARKATFDFDQLRPSDGISGGTGLVGIVRQAQEIPDRLEREAQIARMPNEGEPFHRLAAIKPLVARAAFGFGKEADLLVIADRRNLHSGGFAQFSDGQHQIPLEAIVARDIRFLIR